MTDINPQTFALLQDMLEDIKKGQDDLKADVREGFGKMNGRVRKLENKYWYLMGAMPIVTIVGYWVLKHVFGA